MTKVIALSESGKGMGDGANKFYKYNNGQQLLEIVHIFGILPHFGKDGIVHFTDIK